VRVLVLFAHPAETSFQAALHRSVVESLGKAGHQVDDCDLYAEKFDPCLSHDEWLNYEDTTLNRANVDSYVRRLLDAEALVLVYPVWSFGYPAILKGFFDRVFLPGVSIILSEGKVHPALHNIRKIAAVATYGSSRLRARLLGDGPRHHIKRVLHLTVSSRAPVMYLAKYNMNTATDEACKAFLARVTQAMRAF